MRYLIQIKFTHLSFNKWDIEEHCNTLKKAQSFRYMVDDSVLSAQVVDTITQKIVEVWK